MKTALILLYLFMAVIILIERRHARKYDGRMDRNVAALMLSPDTICGDCGCKQRNHDYGNKNKGHLGASNLMP